MIWAFLDMYKSIILIGLYISFKTDWTVSKEEFLQIYRIV